MRFVTEVSRCDTPTLVRCLMEAFEYFGGLTRVALTDRMKSVLLEMQENKPRWNPRFADFRVSIAVAARGGLVVYTSDEGEGRAHREPCKEELLGRDHVH